MTHHRTAEATPAPGRRRPHGRAGGRRPARPVRGRAGPGRVRRARPPARATRARRLPTGRGAPAGRRGRLPGDVPDPGGEGQGAGRPGAVGELALRGRVPGGPEGPPGCRRGGSAREVQVATFPDPHAVPTEAASELGPVLDAALAGLPEVYRTAVVLCDLQQKSRAEAAALLGVPEGTLSSRLATGRKRLAERLARRGVAVSTAALGAILAERGTAAVPGDLAAKTAEVVAKWTTGGIIAANLRYLMSDGGPVMWKATGVIAAAVAAVGLAVGAAAAWPGADPEQRRSRPRRRSRRRRPRTATRSPPRARSRGLIDHGHPGRHDRSGRSGVRTGRYWRSRPGVKLPSTTAGRSGRSIRSRPRKPGVWLGFVMTNPPL